MGGETTIIIKETQTEFSNHHRTHRDRGSQANNSDFGWLRPDKSIINRCVEEFVPQMPAFLDCLCFSISAVLLTNSRN